MKAWYALHVRSNCERIVARALDSIDVEHYLPSAAAAASGVPSGSRVVSIGDRRRLPLFPGYIFGRFELESRQPVVSIPQVVRLVGVGLIPVAIDDQEIADVRTIESSPAVAMPHPFLAAGDRARVLYGALTGLEGFVVRRKGVTRIVISIAALERSLGVEVDADQLALIEKAPKFSNAA